MKDEKGQNHLNQLAFAAFVCWVKYPDIDATENTLAHGPCVICPQSIQANIWEN